MESLCLKCKGRLFCNKRECVHKVKLKELTKINKKNIAKKDSFESSTYNVFLGHKSYPNLNIALTGSPTELVESGINYDNPKDWARLNYGFSKVIQLRSNTLNSFYEELKHTKSKTEEAVKEAALTDNKLESEIFLRKPMNLEMKFGQYSAPFGSSGMLKKISITSNTKIDNRIEKITDDSIKASEGIKNIVSKGYDEYYITKIFSTGLLGEDKNKKMVPTRWSITAVDDIIGKNILDEIRSYKMIEDYELYYGQYMGNFYLILMMPYNWSYELFEISLNGEEGSKLNYVEDFENFSGRSSYATNCAGGYYSVRLSVLRKQQEKKRQAATLVFRMISSDYVFSLGVWVTREASKRALDGEVIKFNSKEESINYIKNFIKRRFNKDIINLITNSKLIKETRQKKLSDF